MLLGMLAGVVLCAVVAGLSETAPGPAMWHMSRAVRTRFVPAKLIVSSVESTPNPSAFLLKLDSPLEDVTTTERLRGQTFYKGRCPASLTDVLACEGVVSVFVVGQMLTISKDARASWESVLPAVVNFLGGPGEALAASGSVRPTSATGTVEVSVTGGVSIRLQVSQKMPIQVEAAGWSGACEPVRAKLSARFGSAMGLLIEQSGDAFFKGRAWLLRGQRYPELDEPLEASSDLVAAERRAIAAALEAELADIEAAYPDDRLASLVHGSKSAARARLEAGRQDDDDAGDDALLSLEMVDVLVDEDAAAEGEGEHGPTVALRRLAAFVATGRGATGARRRAIAYLGGTVGRGGDAVFNVIAAAFQNEKAAGLRRTAGDALSDLGDERAVPIAIGALADPSKLVRWRAARLVGELGEGVAVVAALNQAQFEEEAFECAFEMKDAARKVALRNEGAMDGGGKGPMWKQIQEGLAGADGTDG